MRKRTTTKKRNGHTNGDDEEHPAADSTVDLATACLTKVEEWIEEIEKYKSAYMNKAKAARVEISGIYASAKDDGVNTKAVKTLVKTRQLEKTMRKAVEALDLDNLASYRSYAEAWDATPLALAAGYIEPTTQP